MIDLQVIHLHAVEEYGQLNQQRIFLTVAYELIDTAYDTLEVQPLLLQSPVT